MQCQICTDPAQDSLICTICTSGCRLRKAMVQAAGKVQEHVRHRQHMANGRERGRAVQALHEPSHGREEAQVFSFVSAICDHGMTEVLHWKASMRDMRVATNTSSRNALSHALWSHQSFNPSTTATRPCLPWPWSIAQQVSLLQP